jgi:hypothetical protein
MNEKTFTKTAGVFFMVFLQVFLFKTLYSQGVDNELDPSGGWRSPLGVLSLMLGGDALSFSYSSVFHSAVHICDGAGVAGLVGSNEYHFVDEGGTVAFIVHPDRVEMRLVSGIASFCGAEWPGETFLREGYEPLTVCRVDIDKSHFHVVMPSPAEKRKGYVVRGDLLETTSCRHEGSAGFVLARFRGPKGTTVGLIREEDLVILP